VSRPAGAARQGRGQGLGQRQSQGQGGHRGVRVSAQRLLPPGWRGPGRRAVWRRARLRRLLAATSTAVAAWLAVSAFLPDPAPVGVPVLVAVRDLPAGHRLGAADVRVDRWPPQIRPVSALREPSGALDATLSTSLGAGEALTASRLRGAGMLSGLPAGLVASHVPLADAGAAGLVQPGDHVDLISSPSGRVVGQDVVVLAVDAPGGDGAGGLVGGDTARPGLVVALTPEAASRVATVDGSDLAGSSVTLALRRPES
jgi:pilus assembly protein CpaB